MVVGIGDILAPPETDPKNTIFFGLGAFIILYLLLKDKKQEAARKKESDLLKLFDLGK